jgi:putative intracellular protease/amidase
VTQPRNVVDVLVFNGMADWEPALALCEIRKKGNMKVRTIGFTDDTVVSMGGLRIVPDTTLDRHNTEQTALFILPGGEMWEKDNLPFFEEHLVKLKQEGIFLAAICGAVIPVAKAGLLKNTRHTSNCKGYIESLISSYAGMEKHADNTLAVTDNGIITASGAGSVEFAREVITLLEIYSPEETEVWYRLFKHGTLPEEYQV